MGSEWPQCGARAPRCDRPRRPCPCPPPAADSSIVGPGKRGTRRARARQPWLPGAPSRTPGTSCGLLLALLCPLWLRLLWESGGGGGSVRDRRSSTSQEFPTASGQLGAKRLRPRPLGRGVSPPPPVAPARLDWRGPQAPAAPAKFRALNSAAPVHRVPPGRALAPRACWFEAWEAASTRRRLLRGPHPRPRASTCQWQRLLPPNWTRTWFTRQGASCHRGWVPAAQTKLPRIILLLLGGRAGRRRVELRRAWSWLDLV